MSWESATRIAKEVGGAGSGKYLRMKDGDDPVVGVFVGEPHEEVRYWNGKAYEAFTDELAEAGEKPSVQFSINFYDINERRMRVMQGGMAFYYSLAEAKELYQEIGKHVFQVKRTGDGNKTRYPIQLLPQHKVPEDLPDPFELAGAPSHTNEDDLPF